MKQFLAIAALLSIGSQSWAQIIDPYECHCGVFIAYFGGETEIYNLHGIQMEGCDDQDGWNDLTNKGDLTTELDNGYTLGQEICLQAVEHFHPWVNNQPGFLNARLCEGNWVDTGLRTRQNICCDNGRYYECEQ